MRINEDIIRHLIVKVDKFDDRDVLISQAKMSFNDDFGAPRDKGYRSAPKTAETEVSAESNN